MKKLIYLHDANSTNNYDSQAVKATGGNDSSQQLLVSRDVTIMNFEVRFDYRLLWSDNCDYQLSIIYYDFT